MPVRYNINSELGIIFIFCEGLVSDVEYFKAVKNMYLDKSYHSGMHRIVDFFSASEDISSLEGIRSVIKFREETTEEKDLQLEHIIVLSYSKGVSLFVNAINDIIVNAKMKYEAASSLEEAITLLGFQDRKQEIIDFYSRSKYQAEPANRSKN